MANQVFLVGRFINIFDKSKIMKLAVNRAYKNAEGIYETDFISVQLKGLLFDKAKEYLAKGDLIGIQGRVEMLGNRLIVVADKLSFLATKDRVSRNIENEEGEN